MRKDFLTKTIQRLQSFNFNTIGWTPEFVVEGSWPDDLPEEQYSLGSAFDHEVDFLHSAPGWSQYELKECGMAYFVQLPVTEIQDWNANPVFRVVNGREFKEW